MIKECPFCGGKGEKVGTQKNGTNYIYVFCTKCGASGPIWTTINPRVSDKENPAIKAWNMRNNNDK